MYAELLGFGESGDAHHMTSPCEEGEGARGAMRLCLGDAGVHQEQVGGIF